jgi:hypothetical protein
MAGHPARNLSVRCAVSQSGRATCENLRRGSPTAITSATPVTARLPSQRSKSMRGRHDNHRRFEVSAANGSRPIAGGRLCGGEASKLFSTGAWICRRSNRCGEILNRLLLFGWQLSQGDSIELLCEGVMRQPQVRKHQVCDHCGGRFGMVTHRWWGNKFCKMTCKHAYLRVTLDRDMIRRWFNLPLRPDTFKLLSPVARIFGRNADQIFAKFPHALEPLVRSTSPLTGSRIAARPVKS